MDNINSVNFNDFSYKAWLQPLDPKHPITDVEVNQFIKNTLSFFNILMQQAQEAAKRSSDFFKENVTELDS